MQIKKRLLTALFALMMCSISIGVRADDVPDPLHKGSVTVTVYDSESKKPVSGGRLTLYYVACIEVDDSDYLFEYTDGFSRCDIALDDIQTEALAETMAAYVRNQKLKGTNVEVDSKGQATFTDLEQGLYLITQDSAAQNYTSLNAFLITIPLEKNGKLVYDVDAFPKAGMVTKTEAPTPNKPTGNKLPQTGQLQWPIPVMAILGMGMFLVGWRLNNGDKKAADEK